MSIFHARRATQTGSVKPAAKVATTTKDTLLCLTFKSIDPLTLAATA
jgi:hypothetical protein